MSRRESTVAEIQGLYGAFSFSEKLLQKIWLRGDFDRNALTTTEGVAVRVIDPGKWNVLGGPDFRAAKLAIGAAAPVVGDVEVHLRAGDWDSHGHAQDPAYDQVVLHVVLFPAAPGAVTRGSHAQAIPTVALLPLLHHDLEEFAGEEAVERLANRADSSFTEALCRLPPAQLADELCRHALRRWKEKAHFARLRVQRLGWSAACHHAALEILGYRFNRAPMLRVAGRWPLEAWGRGSVTPDEVFQSELPGWSRHGVRPVNQPRLRLNQYAAWSRSLPDWPDRLAALAEKLPVIAVEEGTTAARRRHGLPGWRKRLREEIAGVVLGGPRFDTLICDGLLPLLDCDSRRGLHGLWYHWFAGDVPAFVRKGLRQARVFDGRLQPETHGLVQGAIGWLIEHERSR